MIPVEEMPAMLSPVASRRARRPLLAVAFPVVLMAGLWVGDLVAPAASAAPEPIRRLPVTVTPTPQTVPIQIANGDKDLGPGQAEPVLVGSP